MKFKIILIFLLSVVSVTAFAKLTAIKTGKLLNPANGLVSFNQIILIENKKIKEIGEDIIIPDDAEIIDLSNSTVMPGLFDTHTHICSTISIFADKLGVDYFDLVLLNPDGYRAIQGAVHAREMLEAGFTTIREAGNSGKYVDVDVKRAINEGLIAGPTIITAGRIIAPFGGQFRTKADKQFIFNNEYFIADTRDELKKAIRENVFYGSDVIKIVVDAKKYKYSTDDISFIVEEARKAGLKVMAHCQSVEGVYNAVLGGVASVEHGWSLPDSIITLMRNKNIYLVSTDFPVKVLMAFGTKEENAKTAHNKMIERLKRAYEGGVKIAFGSDIMVDIENESRGEVAVSYIESFIEAGIPPADILKIITTNPAELLGVENLRGSLAPGMYCDLIATDENPLDNIRTLKNVTFVMKNGIIYKFKKCF